MAVNVTAVNDVPASSEFGTVNITENEIDVAVAPLATATDADDMPLPDQRSFSRDDHARHGFRGRSPVDF